MLTKLYVLSFLILFFVIEILNAQTYKNIQGFVKDSIGQGIAGATVQLVTRDDTLNEISDNKGFFHFRCEFTNGSLNVKSMGYEPFLKKINPPDDSSTLNIGIIILKQKTMMLQKIDINASRDPVIFKKDTTVYNADFFLGDSSVMVDELIKLLPGMEIDKKGNVKFNGEDITKLRVNGKDFFTNDPRELIHLLPRKIVSKVEIIDDYGDRAAFTGIKSNKREKMINIVTKDKINSGTFGKAETTIGDNQRLGFNINGNYWRDAKQIGVSADLNTASNTIGINNTNQFGFNYRDQLNKKITLSVDYRLRKNRNSSEEETNNNTALPSGFVNKKSSTRKNIHSQNQTIGLGLIFDPDKSTQIRFNPRLMVNNQESNATDQSSLTGQIKQDINTERKSLTKIPAYNIEASISHKFKKAGRTLTVLSSIYIDNTKKTDENFNNTVNYENNTPRDSSLNFIIKDREKTNRTTLEANYIEPINQFSSIEGFYIFNRTYTNINLRTDQIKDNTVETIDSLTNVTKYSNNHHQTGIKFHHNRNKINLSVGAILNSFINNVDVINGEHSTNRSSIKLSPVSSLSYLFSSSRSLNFEYSGNVIFPAIQQIQTLKNIYDISNIIIGNPKLKTSFEHRASLRYRSLSKSNKILSLFLNGTFWEDKIAENTLILEDSVNSFRQETHYLNADGFYLLDVGYNYTWPFLSNSIRWQIALDGRIMYNNNISFSENQKNVMRNINFSQRIRGFVNLENIDFSGGFGYNSFSNNYDLNPSTSSSAKKLELSFETIIKFRKKNNLGIESTKTFNTGYTGIPAVNPFIVNLNLQRKLLKNDALAVSFQALDIFNQGATVSRSFSGNTITDNNTNVLTRYFSLKFQYNISNFGKLNSRD